MLAQLEMGVAQVVLQVCILVLHLNLMSRVLLVRNSIFGPSMVAKYNVGLLVVALLDVGTLRRGLLGPKLHLGGAHHGSGLPAELEVVLGQVFLAFIGHLALGTRDVAEIFEFTL